MLSITTIERRCKDMSIETLDLLFPVDEQEAESEEQYIDAVLAELEKEAEEQGDFFYL